MGLYLGHGEWDTTIEDTHKMSHTKNMETMSTWDRLKLETEDEDLMKAKIVREQGYPNMFGPRSLSIVNGT